MPKFVMTPRTRIRRRRTSSRHGKSATPVSLDGVATLITTFLLAVVLVTGPLVLGADRLWIELPLLSVVALLILIQGLRLVSAPLPVSAPRRADAIDLAGVLFVLYTVVRWLTSPAGYFSRIETMEVIAYAAVFLACRYGMTNRRYCMALLYALVTLGVIETVLGYYLSYHPDWALFDSAPLHLHYAWRWLGTYGSPDHFACFLVMAIGAALALGSFSKLAWPARIILFYLASMMMVGVVFSGSRGGWLAMLASICALVVVGIRNGTMRWWIPVSGAAVLIAVFGFFLSISPLARERLWDANQLILGGKLANDVRIQLARDSLSIAHDYPLFGTGPGTFVFVHPHYQGDTFAYKAELAHNDYLNCLDDYGLVGFALALFFVAAVTLKFFRPLFVDNRWQDRVLVATGFSAWVALMVHSLVDFNLHIPANALLLFSLTGLALGRVNDEKQIHWSTLPLAPMGRWVGGGVIVLALIYGVLVVRMTLSDRTYEQTFAREDVVPVSDSLEGAQEALRYDPGNEPALVFLGDLHRSEASRKTASEDRLSEGLQALEAYQKALQANALDDSVQARIGMTLDVMGKYPEALGHYQMALAAQPYNAQFWSWLGNHYTQSGEPDKAQEAYAQAVHYAHGSEARPVSEKQPRAMPGKDEPQPSSNALSPVAVPAPVPVSPH